jgi:hypothetical protein
LARVISFAGRVWWKKSDSRRSYPQASRAMRSQIIKHLSSLREFFPRWRYEIIGAEDTLLRFQHDDPLQACTS